jgi:hypothetical protein
MPGPIIVGFDMGIRNLAYCVVEHKAEGKWSIVAWDNVDLLEGGSSSQLSKQCCACVSPAVWMDPTGAKWCKGCATGAKRKASVAKKPAHPCCPCPLTVKGLRPLAVAEGVDKKTKKEDLVAWATARYLVPWKPTKAMDASLSTIRKAMDTWLSLVLPTFASASLIRLENQPVMKGPTMKSVQMILFTLLGHRLEKEHGWTGALEFVHAGTKTKESVATNTVVDAALKVALKAEPKDKEGLAYRNRKKTAESDVLGHLGGNPDSAEWLRFFNGRSKKSDLADAFLMALRPLLSLREGATRGLCVPPLKTD